MNENNAEISFDERSKIAAFGELVKPAAFGELEGETPPPSVVKPAAFGGSGTNKKCVAIVKSGTRTGEQCGRIIKKRKSNNLCGYHQNKPDGDGRKTPKFENPHKIRPNIKTCKDNLVKLEPQIISGLDSCGAILLWRCMCGKVSLSDTVKLNRRNILIGLGISKNIGYDQCLRCKTTKCLECVEKYENLCVLCNLDKKVFDERNPVIEKRDGTRDGTQDGTRGGTRGGTREDNENPALELPEEIIGFKTDEIKLIKPTKTIENNKKKSRISRKIRNQQIKH